MSNIVIFKELTTEQKLLEIEAETAKYEGTFVDMDEADGRRFVKDKAYDINQLIKSIEKQRIAIPKAHKLIVNNEALEITNRLRAANAVWTDLIDEHNAKRAKVLAEQKAIDDAKALLIQIEDDHEFAIMHNKIVTIEKAEEAQNKIDRDAKLKSEAIAQFAAQAKRDAAQAEENRLRDVGQAKQDEINKIKYQQEKEAQEKATRESNIAHRTATKTAAKESLMQQANLTEPQAVAVVKSLCAKSILNVTINF